jgi:PAS domain S-box-containing protein
MARDSGHASNEDGVMAEFPELPTIQARIIQLHDALEGALAALREHERLLRVRGQALPSGALATLQTLYDDLRELAPQLANEAVELQQLRALAQTTALINSSLDIDQVLNGVMNTVIALTGAERGYIVLRDERTGELTFRVAANLDPTASDKDEFQISRSIAQRVAETGDPTLIASAIHSEPFKAQDSIRLLGLRSVLCVPLSVQEQVIGVAYLDSRVQEGVFGNKELALAIAFANQAAIAIQNARLYRDLELYSQSLEEAVAERTGELRQALARLAAILDHSSDVILLLQANGMIQQANPAFEAVFGVRFDDVVGHPLTVLIEPDGVESLLDTLETVVERNEPQRIEVVARRRDGEPFDVDMALSPIAQSDQRITGIVCSARDITERKQLERQLRQTLAHEMQVSEMKSRFISMASHDLRNPLAVIRLTSQTLARFGDQLSQEQHQESFARIRSNVTVMGDLLDGVLTIARGEAGRLELKPEAFDLVAFCETLVEEARLVVGEEQEIIFSHAQACREVMMDPKMVRHIVNNLISNAVKYSPEGGPIVIDLTCNGRQAVLRVQDRGIGIPEADQQRLFDLFYRAGNVGNIGGTGLGLAIIKQAVDLHGGMVEFESAEGVGTTFTVTLPT